MWPQKSFVALAGTRRVKGSSFFLMTAIVKICFQSHPYFACVTSFCLLHLTWISDCFCLLVIWTKGFGARTKKYYNGRYANCEFPTKRCMLQFMHFFLLHIWKLPFIFLYKGSSFARGTSIFSLVAALWSNQSWTINWSHATANRFSQGTSINFLRCNKLQIEMIKFLLLRRTTFRWCKH